MNTPPVPGLDPRRWRGLFVLLLGQFCALLDVSITNVALPSIGRATGAGPAELQWIVSGYILAFALMPVIAGRLGDTRGRRRIFFIGTVGFIVASAGVGLSPTPLIMIACRVVQGLFGGLLGPQVSGYIQNAFPRNERGRAFGALGGTVGIGTALGPVIGGLLIGLGGPDLGWRLVFFVNVPIGLVAIVLGILWVTPLKPTGDPRSTQLDVPGAFLLGAGLLCLLFPIVEVNEFHNGWLFLLFLPGAALIAGFIRRELRLSRTDGSPLLDLRLFRVPTFTTGVAFAVVFFCSNTGIPLVLSLFYQEGLGFSALESGLGISAFAVGVVVGSQVAGRFVVRFGRPLVLGAVSLFFVATLIIGIVIHFAAHVTSPVDIILRLAIPLVFLGLAGGSIVTPNQTLTLLDVDPRMGGAAGGVLQTAQRVGSSIGQTVLGTLFFLSVASVTASASIGKPAAHPSAFANALDIGLFGSLAFSGAALVLGLIDLRRKRDGVDPATEPVTLP
ncbi:MAG TPA: MFS transporter [Galbitalea sp.]|jgi:EmrB/QacA subfamily drug resistance transporter|nr:MFS transporter [Galbitalea sp.]